MHSHDVVSPASLSTGVGVTFQQQLSCVRLALTTDGGIGTLLVTSLSVARPDRDIQPASDGNSVDVAHGDSCLRLVLDGRPRTSNVLPTGDPMTGGVPVPLMGDWSIGDYIGSLSQPFSAPDNRETSSRDGGSSVSSESKYSA
ncbi:hypothetical protein ATCC90586_011975 [Pythium insidiosum]|nr:hypothetical protein ATCC90586_011975 [Pythium insidiosum]